VDVITSKDNTKLKYISSLHDRRKARREGVVFIEGVRLCEDALGSGVTAVYAISDEKNSGWVLSVKEKNPGCETLVLSDSCFRKISSTVNPQGVALVVKTPQAPVSIPSRDDKKDIYLCLEDIQDPGNLGTMIRLADAFDFSGILVTQGTADAYNEKVIRASMGSVWRVPIMSFKDSSEIIGKLHEMGVKVISAELHGSELKGAELELPAAYFIGNEGAGLKIETIEATDIRVKIDMQGGAESLNAASAAAIIGYILQEQR